MKNVFNIFLLVIAGCMFIADSYAMQPLNVDTIENQQRFIQAIKNIDIATIQDLLGRGFSPNTDVDEKGNNALMFMLQRTFAIPFAGQMPATFPEMQQDRIIKLFLEHPDFDVNYKNLSGNTALMLALMNNELDVAEILLKNPNLDPNVRDFNGKTALMRLIESKNLIIEEILPLLELFLSNPKLNLSFSDKYGLTALNYAQKRKSKRILNAVESASPENVERRKMRTSIPFEQSLTEIGLSARPTGSRYRVPSAIPAVVPAALSSSAYVRYPFVSLELAIRRYDHDSIAYALRLGANPNETDNNGRPLFFRVLGNPLLLQLFINHTNFNPNAVDPRNSQTALISAVSSNLVNAVQALLVYPRIDLNAMDKKGYTALDYAQFIGNDAITKSLLSYGAQHGIWSRRAHFEPQVYQALNLTLQSNASPYEILGINYDATDKEVKDAYEKLSSDWAPDQTFGDYELMQKIQALINTAYQEIQNLRSK